MGFADEEGAEGSFDWDFYVRVSVRFFSLTIQLPYPFSFSVLHANHGVLRSTLIFDIIRLVALIELSEAGPDITYNQVNASVWTCIEPCVGITAACLSNMRPLFNMLPDVPWRKFSFRSLTSGRHSSDAGKARSMEEGKANNERKKDDHSTTVLELSGQDSGLGGSTLGGSMGSSSRSVRGES